MRTIAAKVTCAVIVALLVLESSTAQCATDGEKECTNVTLPDALGLHQCISTWDLCSSGDNGEESPAKQLVQCLQRSGGMFRLFFLFMEGFKDIVMYFSHFLPRGYVRMMQGLAVFMEEIFQRAFLQLGMHGRAPEGCKKTVNISLPGKVDMTRCVRFLQAFCNPHHSRDMRMKLHLFFSGVACVLKKLPAIIAHDILKEIACIVLTAFITGLRETMAPPLLLFGLKLVKLLLNCDTRTAILHTAERSLANK
ncbi:uncharacterized protein LOC144139040 [Haemaphysalis longicornis]